jgi:hypothetical protein
MLGGCADSLHERTTSSIDVVPLKHTYSVEAEEKNNPTGEVLDYIESNWEVLAQAEVELIAYTTVGKKLSGQVRQFFKEQGKDPNQIKVVESKVESEFGFDFQLVSMNYKTFTPICDYYQIGYFGETNIGCYVEGARWKSMSNPQTMIK